MGHRFLASLFLIAVLALTTLAYAPGMNAEFYFDDLSNVVEREAIHWQRVSVDAFRELLTETRLPTRPVANLSFALNHLAGGLDPTGYHWTNLVVHLLTGLLLAALLRRLADVGRRQATDPGLATAVAITVSALFLLHPLNIQAVTYAVQRMTSMSALFYLAAFWAYIEARGSCGSRRVAFACVAVVAALLAAGCKENTWVLPVAIVVYEFGFHRAEWRASLDPKVSLANGLAAAAALSALVLVAGIYAFGHEFLYWNEVLPGKDHTGWQRLLTQARVHWYYLSLLLWPAPSRLTLDYSFPLSHSLFAPWTTVVAVLGWLVLLGIAVRWLWTRPRWGVPLATYFLLHAIETAPINLEMVYEHRMYLPMFALAWWLVVVSVDWLEQRARWRRPGLVLVALLAVPLAGATYLRNQVWSDPIRFHYDTASKAPDKFRPQYNLATVLGPLGRYRRVSAERASRAGDASLRARRAFRTRQRRGDLQPRHAAGCGKRPSAGRSFIPAFPRDRAPLPGGTARMGE
jgi:hypothetical protein